MCASFSYPGSRYSSNKRIIFYGFRSILMLVLYKINKIWLCIHIFHSLSLMTKHLLQKILNSRKYFNYSITNQHKEENINVGIRVLRGTCRQTTSVYDVRNFMFLLHHSESFIKLECHGKDINANIPTSGGSIQWIRAQ